MYGIFIDGGYDPVFSEEFLRHIGRYIYVGRNIADMSEHSPVYSVADCISCNIIPDFVILRPGCEMNWKSTKNTVAFFDSSDKDVAQKLIKKSCTAVSCGFSEKDTVMVSSCSDGNFTVCVQREIPFNNNIFGVQECNLLSDTAPKHAFPVICAWLIKGLTSESTYEP